MDNKKIIFGVLGLAVVGGVAYFYFKSKSKKTPAQNLMDTLSSSSASSTTSTSSTSNTQSQSNQGTKSGDNVLNNAPINQEPKYTQPLSNNPTQAELDAKAKAIAKAKDLASQICEQKSLKTKLTNISDKDFLAMYKEYWIYYSNQFMLNMLKDSKITEVNSKITSLNKELALLGYLESNCDISKLTI